MNVWVNAWGSCVRLLLRVCVRRVGAWVCVGSLRACELSVGEVVLACMGLRGVSVEVFGCLGVV